MKLPLLLTSAALVPALFAGPNIPATFTYASTLSGIRSDQPSADCYCQKARPLAGETAQAAQKRQMTAELQRLVDRYVADPDLRAKLRADALTQPLRVLVQAALDPDKVSASDRACLKRVTDYFDC